VLMRSAACAALMSLVCACDCHLLGQHARACVQQSGQRTRCNSLLLLPRHVPQAPLVRRRVACMSVEGSEVDPPADEREDNSAFTAFTSEIAQSPLLRQYGAAKAKAALAKAKESLADNVAEEYDAGLDYGRKLRARFLSPRIDDPGLPFADALVCIGGALFIAQWALSPTIPLGIKIPPPSWLVPAALPPTIDWRGIPYILPTLAHGSELAFCWVLGALAANAYESEAYTGTLREAISRTWRAGAFAVGVLLLSTQLATSISLSSQGLDPASVVTTAGIDSGSSADVQIITSLFEVVCDVGVQAVQLTLFRAYRWREAQGPPPGTRGRPDYGADEYNPMQTPPRKK